jgi:hypothetical protein
MKRYHNDNTKGSIFRGFEALSKRKGYEIWDQILLHDDGRPGRGGFGGTRLFGIGGQGGGKTTLDTKVPRQSFYIEGIRKTEFMQALLEEIGPEDEIDNPMDIGKDLRQHLHPETVLWRGREFDSWLVLTPKILEIVYPNDMVRPLRVHAFKDKDLSFSLQDSSTLEIMPIPGLDVHYYDTVRDLCENIVIGGTNIIYPPSKHYMSDMLKETLNMKRNCSSKKNKKGYYDDRRYLAPEIDYKIERDIFLFEIFEFLYRQNTRNKPNWFTAVIDESHDLFRANAPDVYYWIIDCMVDVIVDTRKNNISMACMSHALNLIDYRILERASHFVWLKGAKPSGAYSVVDTRLIKKLKPGQGVNESCMDGDIGGFTFNPLPMGLPQLIVDSRSIQEHLSPDIPDDEFKQITADGDD